MHQIGARLFFVAMTCRVEHIVDWLEEAFPAASAEEWDSVGLLVGDSDAPVERVCVALDPDLGACKAAVEGGASILVTHHPVWIKPPSAVLRQDPIGAVVWEAVEGGLSIACAHTNLDRYRGGPNDILAEKLGLHDVEDFADGIGRMGSLHPPMSPEALCLRAASTLSCRVVRSSGAELSGIERVAVCCGSGASLLKQAYDLGAQALVTGDVKYHDARLAEALGTALIDVGHWASERLIVPWLADMIEKQSESRGWGIHVFQHEGMHDPFRLVTGGGTGMK